MKLKKLALSAFVAGSVLTANAFALVVTLNPSATNGSPTRQLSTDPAFQTDKATTDFASILDIAAAPGSATLNVPFTETGFFLMEAFGGVLNSVSGVTEHYNIYATFSISGTGSWNSSPVFNANGGGLSIGTSVIGSPGAASASGLTFVTPTAGTPTGVSVAGGNDFLLGNSFLLSAINATAIAAGGGIGTTNLNAFLIFVPITDPPGPYETTGPDGFWQAPVPFNVVLSSSATGTPGSPGADGTSYVVNGAGHTIFTTTVTGQGIGSGSGNLLFLAPEPGVLALIGLAFLGMGFVRHRRGSDS